MTTRIPRFWTRRQALGHLAAGGASLLARPPAAQAEPAPETTSIRLFRDLELPSLCYATQYVVEDFLRLEGFTDISYAGYEGAPSEADVLAQERADFGPSGAVDFVVAIDRNAPITVLGGIHAGCVEVFASEAVAGIGDLGGRRLVIGGFDGAEHFFFNSIIAQVGLDPKRDVEWVVERNIDLWPGLLEGGNADVVVAFPPLNYVFRDLKISHVILNTTFDDPWRHFFCCMVAARRDFVRDNPVATRRALRAYLRALELCESDPAYVARALVERGATDSADYAATVLAEVPYGAWRTHDAVDTLRFHALRLGEAGMVKATPNEILARGSDFTFLEALRREMKV